MIISILLCTYNGEKFLEKQLASYEGQTIQNWKLLISDDGSSDRTMEIARNFQNKYPQKVFLFQGPRQGHVANFMTLLAKPEADADYYAFSDQDDIWFEDKLERGILAISAMFKPALYGSRTTSIDFADNIIQDSRPFTLKPCFQNALIQSMMGANTLIFNEKLRKIICSSIPNTIVGHDWHIYQISTAIGAEVIYDPQSTLYYRQHGANLVGANHGFFNKLKRLRAMIKGDFRRWNKQNLESLKPFYDLFTKENKIIFSHYQRAMKGSLSAFRAAGLKRNSRLETCIFMVLTIFKRF